jgi:hypothetical protein
MRLQLEYAKSDLRESVYLLCVSIKLYQVVLWLYGTEGINMPWRNVYSEFLKQPQQYNSGYAD